MFFDVDFLWNIDDCVELDFFFIDLLYEDFIVMEVVLLNWFIWFFNFILFLRNCWVDWGLELFEFVLFLDFECRCLFNILFFILKFLKDFKVFFRLCLLFVCGDIVKLIL